MSIKLSRIVFWSVFAAALIVAFIPRPPPLESSDKFLHCLAFAVLAGLACAAYPRTTILKIGVSLAVVGGVIEVVQPLLPFNRTGSMVDWVADLMGIGIVLMIVWTGRQGMSRLDLPGLPVDRLPSPARTRNCEGYCNGVEAYSIRNTSLEAAAASTDKHLD